MCLSCWKIFSSTIAAQKMDDIYLKVLGGTTLGFCHYHISTFDDKRQNKMTESGCLLGPQHIQESQSLPLLSFLFHKKVPCVPETFDLVPLVYKKLLKELGASQNMAVCAIISGENSLSAHIDRRIPYIIMKSCRFISKFLDE